MIIRSQDKKRITSDLNLYIYEWDLEKYGARYDIRTSTHNPIGTYSTEEKAIMVLDMICDSYQYMKECECARKALGVHAPEFVFQMPQDSEV